MRVVQSIRVVLPRHLLVPSGGTVAAAEGPSLLPRPLKSMLLKASGPIEGGP